METNQHVTWNKAIRCHKATLDFLRWPRGLKTSNLESKKEVSTTNGPLTKPSLGDIRTAVGDDIFTLHCDLK